MKISEIYTSVQGEGPNVGVPTTFIRTGGCNLRCPGWGTYVKVKDNALLPIGSNDATFGDNERIEVYQGCDTIFSVYPEFHKRWENMSIGEIMKQVVAADVSHVCLTGGEPLIQKVEEIQFLADDLIDKMYTIDLFTNGTQPIAPHFGWIRESGVTVIMDYKLPGSGEYGKFDFKNLDYFKGKDWLKFVCKNEDDVKVALDDIDQYNLHHINKYFGVVWDNDELTETQLIEYFSHLPNTRLNVQLHKYLWDPNERRR